MKENQVELTDLVAVIHPSKYWDGSYVVRDSKVVVPNVVRRHLSKTGGNRISQAFYTTGYINGQAVAILSDEPLELLKGEYHAVCSHYYNATPGDEQL